MENHACNPSRRDTLILGGGLLAAPVVAVLALVPGRARAAKAAKGDFFYQPKPKDGKKCATCRFFVTADGDTGSCALVEGEVTANGWCMAFSPRA